MTATSQYRVRRAGEVAGVWREKGQVLPLTERQARELAPPFGHVVEPVTNKEEPNGKLTRRKRADRKAAD